jgi:ATP-binding cassette, subfamily B (MDR/TAP), member 8
LNLLTKLIERFYDVNHGTVTVDGYDVQSLDPRFLRENIGYINQEPSLFATTVMENIRYGNPLATDDQVIHAARDANVDEFVREFPDGYHTVVGEHGASLSGGQKQRIAIARALLRDPKVLILDEATSALDSNSERIVQEALDNLMAGRTVLVIAHRLSTIKKADTIVVMGDLDGNIIEHGTHAELLKKKGDYYQLYQQLT